MSVPSSVPRLRDIIEAIEHIRAVTTGVSLDEFEADWQKRWVVERRLQIISEASRHPGDDVKARHAGIPWPKVTGIGNVLRHEYERIAPDILWKLVHDDLQPLEEACRMELIATEGASDRDL